MRKLLLIGVASFGLAAAGPLAESYRSYNALTAAEREGAAATGAAGVTSTTGAKAGGGGGAAPVLPGGVTADEALGQDVYGPDGETVSEIQDVLLDGGGAVAAVILDAGDLLGLEARQVAVPVDLLRVVADPEEAATGGGGEGGGAAGVTGAAGVGAGTGAGAQGSAAGGDRPQLGLAMGEDELRQLPTYRREGGLWVPQESLPR